jgi:glycerophosphoryl diester phosphodiesterase
MKSLFRPIFALLFSVLLSTNACFADTQIGMPVGFYQVLPGKKIIYLFQELVHTNELVELGLSAIGTSGYFLKTVFDADGELGLTWKKGGAEITQLDHTHYQLQEFRKNKLKETYTLNFLGESQLDAAKTLGIQKPLPVTRYLSHRGTAQIPATHSHSMFPGNTIQAMNISLLNGYDGFELDVQMTSDHQFAVSHDNKLSVSTDCAGYVSDRPLSEVTQCNVRFTGFLPEKKWFHSRASITATIPSLAQVLQQFAPDRRLKRLVIDVKPGDIAEQVEAFAALLKDISPADQSKLIFLIRDIEIQDQLKERGFTTPLYALESSSGWEPLEKEETYFDQRPLEALSLSLGIGLGFAGLHERNLVTKIAGVWSAITSVIDIITNSDGIDIAAVNWSKRNQTRFLELMNRARETHTQIVGWTVNTPLKINWLRKNAPDLDYVISDLPFRSIAKLQLHELESLQ